MKIRKLGIVLISATLFSGAAMAQGNAQIDTQRDVNQKQRIEQGLKTGQLSTKEASGLMRQQQHIDRMQAHALKDGKVSPQEQARLKAKQDKASRSIHAAKHNDVVGNPNSASSKRMQAGVHRSIHQEKRINRGLKTGALTHREAGRLAHAQARHDHRIAHIRGNGHINAR